VIEKVSGMSYEDYVKIQILAPIGIQEMRLGHSLLADRAEGEVRYYGTELTFAPSVFPEIAVQATWPYGGFHLEAMDSHGGWIASAPDLARFAFALDYKNPEAILDSTSLELMFARPEIPLWEEAPNYYALGWQVRPAWKSENIWHAGSLPGTSALLYRTSDGLIWAALFNTRFDAQEDEFFVDLITVMGQAAFLDEILLCSGVLLVCIVGVVLLYLTRRRRTKSSNL
jgi:CubicO group peptidase (beta-lactamase class C family)